MEDGLYRVETPSFVAGFVLLGGEIVQCAPILRKKLEYWKTKAIYIGNYMQITIIGVSIEDVKTAKGGYQKADVAYKNEQGKTEGKKVMSFVNQKVFDVLKQAKSGDVFDVKSEKDANNYWQWVEIAASNTQSIPTYPAAAKVAQGNPSPKSTYETPEERAKKQVYIVRQSSISAAIEYSKSVKALKSTEEVIALARQFEAYVFEEAKTTGGLFDMKDDTDGIV